MRKVNWLCLAVAAATPAFSGPMEMQPGLWEMKPLKIISDGQDNSAKMQEGMAKAQAAMANMPPEQRAQVEAMMKQHGMSMETTGGNTVAKICMSPDMAKRHALPVGRDGKCQPSYSQAGNFTSFSYSCQNNGTTSTGKGTITVSGNQINIVSDGTSSGAGGSHTDHIEVQMNYLGSDCGDLKPAN